MKIKRIKNSKVHLTLLIIWALLLIPTIIWWKESVLWIGIMSVYAIVSTHWDAYQTAKVEESK